MKIMRYKKISSLGCREPMIECDNLPKRKEFDESVADRRYFTPIRDSVRSVPAGSISKQAYDFPDGRDTGIEIPISRKKGVDISEISQSVRKEQDRIKGEIEASKNFEKFKKSLEPKKSTEPSK